MQRTQQKSHIILQNWLAQYNHLNSNFQQKLTKLVVITGVENDSSDQFLTSLRNHYQNVGLPLEERSPLLVSRDWKLAFLKVNITQNLEMATELEKLQAEQQKLKFQWFTSRAKTVHIIIFTSNLWNQNLMEQQLNVLIPNMRTLDHHLRGYTIVSNSGENLRIQELNFDAYIMALINDHININQPEDVWVPQLTQRLNDLTNYIQGLDNMYIIKWLKHNQFLEYHISELVEECEEQISAFYQWYATQFYKHNELLDNENYQNIINSLLVSIKQINSQVPFYIQIFEIFDKWIEQKYHPLICNFYTEQYKKLLNNPKFQVSEARTQVDEFKKWQNRIKRGFAFVNLEQLKPKAKLIHKLQAIMTNTLERNKKYPFFSNGYINLIQLSNYAIRDQFKGLKIQRDVLKLLSIDREICENLEKFNLNYRDRNLRFTNIIVFFGESRIGKTTVMNLIANYQSVQIQNSKYVANPTQFSISNGLAPETRQPQFFLNNSRGLFIDLPGYDDSDAFNSESTQILLHWLFQRCENIVFLLFLPEEEGIFTNILKPLQALDKLDQIFKIEIENINLGLVLTKASCPDFDHERFTQEYTDQNLQNIMQKNQNNNQFWNDNYLAFLHKLRETVRSNRLVRISHPRDLNNQQQINYPESCHVKLMDLVRMLSAKQRKLSNFKPLAINTLRKLKQQLEEKLKFISNCFVDTLRISILNDRSTSKQEEQFLIKFKAEAQQQLSFQHLIRNISQLAQREGICFRFFENFNRFYQNIEFEFKLFQVYIPECQVFQQILIEGIEGLLSIIQELNVQALVAEGVILTSIIFDFFLSGFLLLPLTFTIRAGIVTTFESLLKEQYFFFLKKKKIRMLLKPLLCQAQ